MRFGVGALAVSLLVVGCGTTLAGDEWSDWTVTVYYTAVESLYAGPRETVRGCGDLECADADREIGSLPRVFVATVRDEGTGRITSGAHAGKYLNWSYDVGFWLDTQPRDSRGEPLRPFETAAADGVAPGTRLRLADCGDIDSDYQPACAKFSAATWTIGDEFTPGLGGDRHIDLYVGEETTEIFTDGPDFVMFTGATLQPIG